MRKFFVEFFATLLILWLISTGLSYFITSDIPSYFDMIHKQVISDPKLINRIGGYRSHEYEFNKYEMETGRMHYSIKIIGRNRNLKINGIAQKRGNDWIVITKDTLVEEK